MRIPSRRGPSLNSRMLEKMQSRDSFSVSQGIAGAAGIGPETRSQRVSHISADDQSEEDYSGELRENYDELELVMQNAARSMEFVTPAAQSSKNPTHVETINPEEHKAIMF